MEDQAGLYRGHFASCGEAVQDQSLEVLDVAGGDVDEVVLRAGQVVERAGLWLGQHVGDEGVDERSVMRADMDSEEGLHWPPKRGRIQT